MTDRRDPPVSFRPGALAPALDARADPGSGAAGRNPVARRDLARLYAALAAELRRRDWAPAEALALADACAGWVAGDDDARMLGVRVKDAIDLDGIATRHGLDAAAFLARVAALSPAGALAVVDACERFWALAGADPDADADAGDLLRAVGLLR